ncbi:unnamed protein product, partial [Cylicocyclus nassatus]
SLASEKSLFWARLQIHVLLIRLSLLDLKFTPNYPRPHCFMAVMEHLTAMVAWPPAVTKEDMIWLMSAFLSGDYFLLYELWLIFYAPSTVWTATATLFPYAASTVSASTSTFSYVRCSPTSVLPYSSEHGH